MRLRLPGEDSTRPGEVDHVVPVARGGTHDLANLRLTCKRCNQRRGSLEGIHSPARGRP